MKKKVERPHRLRKGRFERAFFGFSALGLALLGFVAESGPAHAGQRKPSSVQRRWISCVPLKSAASPARVDLIESPATFPSKWRVVEFWSAEKRVETLLSKVVVVPQGDFSVSDAWSGSTRFLESIRIEIEGNALTVITKYDPISRGYPGTFSKKPFVCAVLGTFNEVLTNLSTRYESK